MRAVANLTLARPDGHGKDVDHVVDGGLLHANKCGCNNKRRHCKCNGQADIANAMASLIFLCMVMLSYGTMAKGRQMIKISMAMSAEVDTS